MSYSNGIYSNLITCLKLFKKRSLSFLLIFTLITSASLIGQNKKVTGENVTFVKFGNNSSNFLGTFMQKGGNKQWVEEGKRQGVVLFKYRETHRDAWSVYLTDNSRGVKIQLDLHTKKVMYSDKRNPTKRFLYTITESYTGINGWTVKRAVFGNSSGFKLGAYVQKSKFLWVEKTKSGKIAFKFKEVGRDEWSVYLKDDSRGVKIQLDLHTKKVMYSHNNSPYRVLYFIRRVF